MIITPVKLKAAEGQPFYRALMSDLHLGSANSDHDYIARDLATAKRWGARVLINGDVFDAICPTDKRYDATVLHPLVRGKKDLTKAIVDMAYELLSPYASIIDVMGIGNHEQAWIKYNHTDPVTRLIERLNAEAGGKVKHGGFAGFINTTFDVIGEGRGCIAHPKHRLLYYHGTGGDSPVTKGTIDFNRKGRNWKYDLLTFGHKHNELCAADAIANVSDDDRYYETRQLNLQTPSYYRNYRELKPGEELDGSYASDKSHPPKPMGAIFVTLRPRRNDVGVWEVRQDYASDLIAPWGYEFKAA